MSTEYDNLRINVQRIANGFIVTSGKDEGYSFAESDGVYHPTMESVELSLVAALRDAAAITRETAKGDF